MTTIDATVGYGSHSASNSGHSPLAGRRSMSQTTDYTRVQANEGEHMAPELVETR